MTKYRDLYFKEKDRVEYLETMWENIRKQNVFLLDKIQDAEEKLADIGILMGCDETEIREVMPDFCADQAALDLVNKYFERWRKND